VDTGVSMKDMKRNEVIRKTLEWHALLTKYERPDCDGTVI